MKNKKYRGFTLIELLIVVAIIGLLSAVIMIQLDKARMKSRDSQRKVDISKISMAIEQYITNNRSSPTVGGSMVANDADGSWSILESELKPYISSLPKDPCGAGCSGASSSKWFVYNYITAGPHISSDYYLYAENLESTSGPFKMGSSF
ncbi:MAG: type II secretion system protein [Candidatus Nomurabacteria bacterium]|nr:type II secretion system protein [Candidatus Nomurabacteria bacterium]